MQKRKLDTVATDAPLCRCITFPLAGWATMTEANGQTTMSDKV